MENTLSALGDHYKNLTGSIQYHLTNDYMFRAVMQRNENVLKHLLCAILQITVSSVTSLEIQNPIVLGEEINSKTCILDIKLLLNNSHYYNIEMQVSKQKYWKERSVTYLCRLYDNLKVGREYDEVIPAIQISILDFDLFDDVEELCSRYYLINENEKYHNRYVDGFGIYTLNLNQIRNEKVKEENQNNELYQWAQVFKANTWEEIRMLAEKNEAIDECVCTLAELSKDDKIRMQCEARADSEAIEKGLYNRGLKEGIQKGRSEGAEQLLVQLITAKRKNDIDISTIAAELMQTEAYIKELMERYQIK